LSWDLGTLAVALVTTTPDLTEQRRILALIVIAKLAQCLAEPELRQEELREQIRNSAAPAPEEVAMEGGAVSPLEGLRAILAAELGVSVSSQAAAGQALRGMVCDRLRPLVCQLCLLHNTCVVAGPILSAEVPLGEALNTLGLPGVEHLANDPHVRELCVAWAQLAREHHDMVRGWLKDKFHVQAPPVAAGGEPHLTPDLAEEEGIGGIPGVPYSLDREADRQHALASMEGASAPLEEPGTPGRGLSEAGEAEEAELQADGGPTTRTELAAVASAQLSAPVYGSEVSFPPLHVDAPSTSLWLMDQSHLSFRRGTDAELISLPERFTDLYARVTRDLDQLRDPPRTVTATSSLEELDDAARRQNREAAHAIDPAICLVTGKLLSAGAKPNENRPVGECTLHARSLGAGVGVFFLVQKCTVLVIRDSHAAYLPSLYLDINGEEDPGLRRGKPLFLSRERYNQLRTMYATHQLGPKVCSLRSVADRVIRENYY